MSFIDRPLVPAIAVALGLFLGGAAIGGGVARIRTADRAVTVKGVAEREVKADLAIWPLRVVAADNDLARANASLAESVRKVKAFLAANGLDTTQISVQNFAASDAEANQYRGRDAGGARFVIRQALVLRSTEPQKVLAASQRVADLVSAGVVLNSEGEYGGGGPTFLFTKLNDFKPKMIAEATARARESAEQFARDSRSDLGGIRRANQGVFEILPRDPAPGITQESQVEKTLRVVTTVEYALK